MIIILTIVWDTHHDDRQQRCTCSTILLDLKTLEASLGRLTVILGARVGGAPELSTCCGIPCQYDCSRWVHPICCRHSARPLCQRACP